MGNYLEETKFKLHYRGSLFWLIFWIIVFFPIAFVLLLTNSSVRIGGITYSIEYNGSQFWLGFWILVFFPVAFALLFVNGLTVKEERPVDVTYCKHCDIEDRDKL
jgi:hypothetical protein